MVEAVELKVQAAVFERRCVPSYVRAGDDG
jgi:hypothetical protein